MNCTATIDVQEGDEIISINGMAITEIMRQLLARQIRDGYNQTYPLWILNTYFKSYYSFTFGHPEVFSIIYKNDNNIKTKIIAALPGDSIRYYRQQKYAQRFSDEKDKQGITLELMNEIKTAVLTIKDFHNDILKNVYHQNFSSTIKNYFSSVASNNIEQIILDLRNNQGGYIENGKELLSYLLDKRFNIIDKDPSSGIMQPKENVFKGKLYVLINGGSFSNSGIVSSCIEKNNRAIFIGQETGDNKYIINGNPKSGALPNTQIKYEIPATEYLLRKESTNDGHGILPAYYSIPVITDIINNKDKAKELAIELAGKK